MVLCPTFYNYNVVIVICRLAINELTRRYNSLINQRFDGIIEDRATDDQFNVTKLALNLVAMNWRTANKV